MAEPDEICCMCEKALKGTDYRSYRHRALQTLINASKELGDNKYLKFQDADFINMHRNCNARYIRAGYVKKEKRENPDVLREISRTYNEARKFDWAKQCLLCGCEAIENTCVRSITFVSSDSTKDTILEALKAAPDNDYNNKIKLRLEYVKDLVKSKARYHCDCMEAFGLPGMVNQEGESMTERISTIAKHVIDHIVENSDDSQFSLKELLKDFNDDLPDVSFIEQYIKDYFEDELRTYAVPNDLIMCFINKKENILDDKFYEKKASSDRAERNRIVMMAANIILQDIRAKKYDTQTSNLPLSLLNNTDKQIPATLKSFLDVLIKSNKRLDNPADDNKWSKRVSTIAHMLIACVRPRTFMSSILFGLSSYIHKFAGRGLLQALSYIGMCHNETLPFGSSINNDPEQLQIRSDAFIQFTSDNVEDQNTNRNEDDDNNTEEMHVAKKKRTS